MKLYSTNNQNLSAGFAEAVFSAMPSDGGLYMPTHIPQLPHEFWQELPDLTLQDIAVEVSKLLLIDEIAVKHLEGLVRNAIDFPAPLLKLTKEHPHALQNYVLELHHGPSLAFKDFGARFMAGLMDYFLQRQGERLIILVATSGDTGGAVAMGFHGSANIDVVILYPKGRVSDVQEAQLTSLGGNITTLAVSGSFDDCQALVKAAFVDDHLRKTVNISSANSINISRLIPQSFYYIDAYRQWILAGENEAPVFAVPSGNFGNLTAGIIAEQMGLPVAHWIAATNANDTVVRYASSGHYQTKDSVATLSNAMDVGAPSNFIRMHALFGSTWNSFKNKVFAVSVSDGETEYEMRDSFRQNPSYLFDPHTAVASRALHQYQTSVQQRGGIIIATAHPAKFQVEVERIIESEIAIPEAIRAIQQKPRRFIDIGNDYASLKSHVLDIWSSRG